MLFLILAILLNGYLAIVFKLFPRFRIDSFQAIVFNYATCVITGSLFLDRFPVGHSSFLENWFPWSLGMGTGFIILFNLIAYSTRKDGVAVTTVANKLSLVIPVLFAVFLYREPLTGMKIAGLLLALPAVYLSAKSTVKDIGREKKSWLWPVLLFTGSGLLDTAVNFVTQKFFKEGGPAQQEEQAVYLVHCFAAAGIIGLVVLTGQWIMRQRRFAWRHLLAGIVVGVPNFFSIYFLIKLLNSGFMQTSAAIPVTNIGVVFLASVCAITFFREEKSWQRLAGIGLSVVAILLLAFSGA